MSRFHPSWPSPLLALDPIRLRPMGWLDDLLPMRPPSLWRDRSLYARALRWQPDMADLSWLFDAYAMLGIEMPPPRIEHRTHQRSPQRGRLKGNARQTQLRRRRAPVKGANRPLAIPRWSTPPQMVAPTRSETQQRVETAPSFKSRRTVVSPNLAKVEWRSPERSAPIPTMVRGTSSPLAPSLGSQPTLLRKADSLDESKRSPQAPSRLEDTSTTARSTGETPDRISPRSKPSQEVLAPRKPTIQRFPTLSSAASRKLSESPISEHQASPPPKVTWQHGHARSPWRLNQTGRTLFNPQTVVSKPAVTESNRSVLPSPAESIPSNRTRLADKITRIGNPVRKRKPLESSEPKTRSFNFRPVVEQVEWSPVRKGLIRDAVLDQGTVRSITPLVQMDLPPSPKKGLEEVVSIKQTSSSPTMEKESPSSLKTSGEFQEAKAERTTKVSSVNRTQPSKNQSKNNEEVQSAVATRSSVDVEAVVVQAGRARLLRQPPHRKGSQVGSVEGSIQQAQALPSTSIVQVPTRVPWRLRPSISSESVSGVQKTIRPDRSVNPEARRAATPVSQQTSTSLNRRRQRIPQVSSWFLPQRQRLIEHFQTQRVGLQQRDGVDRLGFKSVERDVPRLGTASAKPKSNLDANNHRVAPGYNFASPNSSTKRVFRVQEQTMVAPLRAGTLVFPTPVIQDQPERPSDPVVDTRTSPKKSAPSEDIAVQKKSPSTERTVSGERTRSKDGSPSTTTTPKQASKTDPITQTSSKMEQTIEPLASVPNRNRKQSSSVSVIENQRDTEYPEPFVQSKDVYQRRRVQTAGASWRLKRRVSPDVNVSPVTKALQEKATQRRWRQPYIPLSETGSQTSVRPNLVKTPPQLSTSKSVFRAPSTFWQGSFTRGRGSVQLQSPMVFTTLDSELDRRPLRVERTKSSVPEKTSLQQRNRSQSEPRWIPQQILDVKGPSRNTTRTKLVEDQSKSKGPSASPPRTPVRSVSWSRKPRFPDPFVAHQRSILSTVGSDRTEKKGRPIPTTQESLTAKPRLVAPQSEVKSRTLVQSEFIDEDIQSSSSYGDLGVSPSSSRTHQAPRSKASQVRRVVAPTLSAAIVYNSISVDPTSQRSERPSGQYTTANPSSQQVQTSTGTMRVGSDRPKSIGKYGPTRSKEATRSTDKVTGLPATDLNPTSESVQLDRERDKSIASDDRGTNSDPAQEIDSAVEAVIEQKVRQTVQNLVRRLPTTQQALLRSKISLPTKWARRLGLAPTAEVRMGWRLQRTLGSTGSLSSGVSTPRLPSGTQQFVIPSGEYSEESAPTRSQRNQTVESSSNKAQPSTEVGAPKSSKRRLSNTQINRIIERQVSFFRSAQRQSFLKASQMTEGVSSSAVPSPARGGLQQVTGEMRKALQRMVFSSESQPVFLDIIPDIDVSSPKKARSESTQEFTVSKNSTKTRTVQKNKRLGVRTPQWRPGIHTPAPHARYGRTRTSQQRNSVAGSTSNQGPSLGGSARVQSVPPNSAPMTMLQAEESIQAAEQNSVVTKSESVPDTRSTKGNTSTSTSVARRPKGPRGRSSTVVPLSLMGQSDVGVFLQPKGKSVDQADPVAKAPSQSADSVDSEADVFMVDPTGNLLTGEKAKKRLKELGFARTKGAKSKKSSEMDPSSGSYTWQAPAEMMEEAVKQVRKEMAVQEKVKESSTSRPRAVRQSVIKEWTEEQLLTILVELASSSPEANALLRDVQERVEEYFDLERFRKI